jgi:uncharacterized protein (TIRG00374 family)
MKTRRGGSLTAALGILGFLATVNLGISLVRLALALRSEPSPLRVAAEVLVAAGATALAVRRSLRGRAAEREPPSSAPPALAQADAAGGGAAVTPRELPAPGPEAPGAAGPAQPHPRTRRQLWLHRAKLLLIAGLIALAAVTVAGEWPAVLGGVRKLAHLRWRWVRWAIYAEALSLVAYAWLEWILVRAGGRRVRMIAMIGISLAGYALSSSSAVGVAWGTTFSYEQLRRRGVGRRLAALVLLLTFVLSLVALIILIVAGVDLAGSHGPAAAFRPLVTTAVVSLLVMALLWRVPAVRRGLAGRLRRLAHSTAAESRIARALSSVGHAISRRLEGELGHEPLPHFAPRTWGWSLVAALLNWLADCACLVASILAVGGHIPWGGLLVIYGVTQIAENLPITPGGIGVVEGTLTLLLVAYGMPVDSAVASVLLYRIISFWLLSAIGWATVGGIVLSDRRARSRRPGSVQPGIREGPAEGTSQQDPGTTLASVGPAG